MLTHQFEPLPLLPQDRSPLPALLLKSRRFVKALIEDKLSANRQKVIAADLTVRAAFTGNSFVNHRRLFHLRSRSDKLGNRRRNSRGRDTEGRSDLGDP